MKNLYYYSKQFITLLEKHKELLQILYSITEISNDFSVNQEEILNVPNNQGRQVSALTKQQNDIRENNDKILKTVRSIRPNRIYDITNSLIQDLNLFDLEFNDDNSLIIGLKEFPEKHTDAYSEKQARQIFEVSDCCQNITKSFDKIKVKSLFIIEEFEKKPKTSPDDYFSLKIGSDQDIPLIENFVVVFKGIDDLYNFICYIYKIDSKVNQLLVNHIATGSWYTELLGIKQVVISIENLLKGIGTLIRDLITGKIDREKFENKCKKAEAFIELVAKAKEHGIDNAELGLLKKLSPLVDNFCCDTTAIDIGNEEILKLRKNEKLTLIERKSERASLVEKINLSLGEGNKKILDE